MAIMGEAEFSSGSPAKEAALASSVIRAMLSKYRVLKMDKQGEMEAFVAKADSIMQCNMIGCEMHNNIINIWLHLDILMYESGMHVIQPTTIC